MPSLLCMLDTEVVQEIDGETVVACEGAEQIIPWALCIQMLKHGMQKNSGAKDQKAEKRKSKVFLAGLTILSQALPFHFQFAPSILKAGGNVICNKILETVNLTARALSNT